MSEESYLRAIARYDRDLRDGSIRVDHRTGECTPTGATQAYSWGSACPPGFCPPENMPQALNRWFAGDRAGCKELPYTVLLTGTRQVAVDTVINLERVSKVTMCPTRLIVSVDGGPWRINTIQFGNQNQLIGGPMPANALQPQAFQAVPFVPDCLRAGQPFTINATIALGVAEPASLWLTFIGPMVG